MSEYEDRKRLTFEEAEGVAPIPAPLALKEVSRELRARLWAIVYNSITESSRQPEYSKPHLVAPWSTLLEAMHIYRDYKPADEFTTDYGFHVDRIKTVIMTKDYVAVFGWLQWVLRRSRIDKFAARIRFALETSRAAYRLLDDDKTIIPVGSDAELTTIKSALVDLSASEFHGARLHLTKAAQQLTDGQIADSIRESIHAVESVARVLEPHGDFSKALARLEAKVKIHGALKNGFSSIYGFTSDEKGIRHPMLEKGSSDVDETDALFMIGACAAFVSYLINKSRGAGLIG
jgi:hypothetical protein